MGVLGLLRKSRVATLGAVVLILLAFVAIFAPLIAPYGEGEQVGAPFEPPSRSHWLGLDDGGTDVLSQLIYGARTSLLIGFAAACVILVIGGTVGILSGYFGGLVDSVLMRITDYFLVMPQLLLAMVAAALWGSSLWHLVVVIGLVAWTGTARLLRAQAKSLTGRSFVKRDRALGSSHLHTIRKHVVPHLAPLMLVGGVLAIADAVFAEAALSFLGLGDPNAVSWGKMIASAFDRAAVTNGAWWAIAPPGLAIAAVVCACSMVGRGLELVLDPRLDASHITPRTFKVEREPPSDSDPEPPDVADASKAIIIR